MNSYSPEVDMCLAIPSKVVEIYGDGTATVDTMGVKRRISLELMQEEVDIGDYVLIHVGFAIQKLNEEEALKSLELFEEIVRELEEEESMNGAEPYRSES